MKGGQEQAVALAGNSVALESVALEVTGAAFNFLVNWSSKTLTVTDASWSGNKWAWPGWQTVLQSVSLENQRIVPRGTAVRYSPAYGFVCDASTYAAEAEQCKAVVEKYNKGLLCGFLEPESTIPAFLRELEDAGIDAIIQEKQRQLDAWLAQNGK